MLKWHTVEILIRMSEWTSVVVILMGACKLHSKSFFLISASKITGRFLKNSRRLKKQEFNVIYYGGFINIFNIQNNYNEVKGATNSFPKETILE